MDNFYKEREMLQGQISGLLDEVQHIKASIKKVYYAINNGNLNQEGLTLYYALEDILNKTNSPSKRRGMKPMCSHHIPVNLSYIAWYYYCEAKAANGEEQTLCPDCKHWFWAEELGNK